MANNLWHKDIDAILEDVPVTKTIVWCYNIDLKAIIFQCSKNYGSPTRLTRWKLKTKKKKKKLTVLSIEIHYFQRLHTCRHIFIYYLKNSIPILFIYLFIFLFFNFTSCYWIHCSIALLTTSLTVDIHPYGIHLAFSSMCPVRAVDLIMIHTSFKLRDQREQEWGESIRYSIWSALYCEYIFIYWTSYEWRSSYVSFSAAYKLYCSHWL